MAQNLEGAKRPTAGNEPCEFTSRGEGGRVPPLLNRFEDFFDRGLGSILGACIGDAMGATFEFLNRFPTPKELDEAVSLPGDGVLKVAPGQVTDDGELTLCLSRALSESSEFDLDRISQIYIDWYKSGPFDIGTTTSNALGFLNNAALRKVASSNGLGKGMSEASRILNVQSKANGSLMRAGPLGVWGFRLPPEQLARIGILDSRLTHSNPSCCDAVACYVLAIGHLIRNPSDGDGAFKKARDWASGNANEEVNSWLESARGNENPSMVRNAGFVRIAFINSFRHLLLKNGFIEAMKETLAGGGDSDTNACILGGLMGAFYGASGLPESMRKKVLEADTSKGRHPRPEWLHPRQLPSLVEKLIKIGPTSLDLSEWD